MHETIARTKQCQAFGKPILDFQKTQFVLAACKAEVLAGKTLVDYCVQRYLDGAGCGRRVLLKRLFAKESERKNLEESIAQTHENLAEE